MVEHVQHAAYSKPRVSKSRANNRNMARYKGYVTHQDSKSVDTYPTMITP